MSYELQAVVGHRDGLSGIIAAHSGSALVELHQGFALIPVLEDRLGNDEPVSKPFVFLTSRLEASIREASKSHPLAYVEAEFFGGSGIQTAGVWSGGEFLYHPEATTPDRSTPVDDAPINRALRALGVRREGRHDEFGSVGLDRFRHTEDWVQVPAILASLLTTAAVWESVPGSEGVFRMRVASRWLFLARDSDREPGYVVRAHGDPVLTLRTLPVGWRLK